jgi:hypothetical protein
MTTQLRLLNPDGRLLPEIERKLFLAFKTKPLWAKQLQADQEVMTNEGPLTASAGDYLCRGAANDQWPQKANKLYEKYSPCGQLDPEGWQRFDPKPEAAPVEAALYDSPFRIVAQWGELTGKANDYLVRSTTDPTDIWIVGRAIFEASYEPQKSDQ